MIIQQGTFAANMFLHRLIVWAAMLFQFGTGKTANEIYNSINAYYDSISPPLFHLSNLQPHHHGKRCSIIESATAAEKFLSGTWKEVSLGSNALVSTPCLGTDSLGNGLRSYFENIVCANRSGIHYVSVAKVWEPKDKDIPSPFLERLPGFIESSSSVADASLQDRIKQECRCPGSCHERSKAVWIKGLDIIKPILQDALQYHLTTTGMGNNLTIVSENDLSTERAGSSLPLFPDAAIHYRCGDNFVGHYGFLPVSAFKTKIPSDAKTIYVLAENRDRKTKHKKHLAAKCDAIFTSLFAYLTKHFPKAKVLIRRGDDLYVDMARLSYAKTTICSVSTFCLWPAIINPNVAYFPRTKLIVGGDTSIDLGFKWLMDPAVVSGAQNVHTSPAKLLNDLNH